MRRTYAQLIILANIIKNETISKANTATRVGSFLVDLTDTALNQGDLLPDWDMSTNLFPANSAKGVPYFGINGPTNTLLDRAGNRIPNGAIATPLQDGASQTDPTQWALEYTITA